MSTLSIGCDIAKDSFGVTVWLDDGKWLGTFPNATKGYKKLQRQIAQLNPDKQPQLLVVEPTGGYELPLVDFARRQGWQVALPNPKQVRDWAKGVGYRAKNDPQDSLMLAQYGVERNPEPQDPLPEEIEALEALSKRRQDLLKMRQAESNRLKQLKRRPRPSRAAIDSIERILQLLDDELKQVEKAIDSHVKNVQFIDDLKKRLLEVPGIGKQTVADIIVLLYRWEVRTKRKGGYKSLTAFVGLDSKTNDSGKSSKYAPISKQGAARFRCSLYMAALGGVRGNNKLRHSYQAMVGRGKAKKVALVAASRKILVWAWALFTTGESFDASKHPLPQSVA